MATEPCSTDVLVWLERLELRLLTALSRKRSAEFTTALGAIVGDLLRTFGTPAEGLCYHGLGVESFNGSRIGYRPFLAVTDALVQVGYLERRVGIDKHECAHDGVATRFRATIALIADVAAYGVQASRWQDHFKPIPRPAKVPSPILLRKASWHRGKVKVMGESLPVDFGNPTVAELAAQVDRINAAFVNVEITGADHQGFRRIFTDTRANHNYEQAGRLYSSFQNEKKNQRHLIQIDGQKTVELDIKNSHTTIIHGMLNIPRPDRIDLFDVGIPNRKVVKRFVNASLGNGKFHKRWPRELIDAYKIDDETKDRDLCNDYPIDVVRQAVLNRLPVTKAWVGSNINWADLQYIESCVLIDALEELLIVHGIATLPLHDALLVPVSDIEIARTVLAKWFKHYVGIDPILEMKDRGELAMAA